MKLLREYIRTLLESKYGWEVATKENMMLDQEGMDISDRENQEQYLKSLGLMETTSIPIGQCYSHATKMAKDSTKQEFNDLTKFKVVHGKITDKFSGESVLHAWVEKGDTVFDWQTSHTKSKGIDKATYYDMYNPEPHNEYTAEEILINCIRSSHHGPWT